MNTLTRFITPVFELPLDHAKYEVVENMTVKEHDLKDLTISGSLFSLTTFIAVNFESCVFFASKIENCRFINCTFNDCKFEFSHFSHCNFQSTNFENCSWEHSSFENNEFNHGKIDSSTHFVLKARLNILKNMLLPKNPDWSEINLFDDYEAHDEQQDNQWGTKLMNFFKAA